MAAIGNAIFVRDRKSLTKNEQSKWNQAGMAGQPSGLLESLKIQGMTYCFAFSRVGQLETAAISRSNSSSAGSKPRMGRRKFICLYNGPLDTDPSSTI
jgi:hypothetical protein